MINKNFKVFLIKFKGVSYEIFADETENKVLSNLSKASDTFEIESKN